jgi:hypothetical protein
MALAVAGDDVTWIARSILDLLTEFGDMHINRAGDV